MRLNSITIKLILLLVIIITVIMSITGIYDFISNKNLLTKNMNNKLNEMPETIAVSISSYYLNFQMDQLKEIIRRIMQDQEIYGITIKEMDNRLFYAVKRDEKWKLIEAQVDIIDKHKNFLISKETNIMNNYAKIGKIELFLTKKFFNESLIKSILGIVIKIVTITIVSIILLALFLNKILLSNIKLLSSRFKDFSYGEGDLTIQLEIKTKDEIGDLCMYFNQFVSKLNSLIIKIKNVIEKNKNHSVDLSSHTEELSATITEISSTMNSMNQKIENLDQELEKAKNAITNVGKFTDKAVLMIDDQSSSVSESSSSIEEMIANINNITVVVEDKKNLSMQLADMAKTGESSMKDTIQSINDITKSTEIISEMINVINNVAAQTDLLAMNAAIEASHAGEFGKGFSVVAEEIRKLAEATGQNSKNISLSLKTVIDKIKSTETISFNTNQIITQLINGIIQISDSMNETLMGLKEVNIGTGQITISLTNLIKITEDIKESSKNLKDNFNDINYSIKNVYDLAGDNKNAISETTISIEEIKKSIFSLTEMSGKNMDNIKTLEDNISKFKINK